MSERCDAACRCDVFVCIHSGPLYRFGKVIGSNSDSDGHGYETPELPTHAAVAEVRNAAVAETGAAATLWDAALSARAYADAAIRPRRAPLLLSVDATRL